VSADVLDNFLDHCDRGVGVGVGSRSFLAAMDDTMTLLYVLLESLPASIVRSN